MIVIVIIPAIIKVKRLNNVEKNGSVIAKEAIPVGAPPTTSLISFESTLLNISYSSCLQFLKKYIAWIELSNHIAMHIPEKSLRESTIPKAVTIAVPTNNCLIFFNKLLFLLHSSQDFVSADLSNIS